MLPNIVANSYMWLHNMDSVTQKLNFLFDFIDTETQQVHVANGFYLTIEPYSFY